MENNNLVNATNEQVQIVEPEKKIVLGIKTSKEIKAYFDELPGVTNEDKYLNLVEAYEKQIKEEDKFILDSQMEAITSALDTARKQVDSIESLVNQRKQKLKETYIDDIGAKLEIVAHHIENEKVLNAEIIELRSELENKDKAMELLQKRFEEKEMMVTSGKEKIFELEADSKKYLALNSELVNKENNYINELREKDAVISDKTFEIDRLNNAHKQEIKALEEDYKANLDKTHEEYKVKINELEKDNAVNINKVSNLESNIVSLGKQNTELKASVEVVRAEAKKDIKELEKEHRSEIKALEVNVKELEKANNLVELEKAKMESKIENLDENIKGLQEERNGLKQNIDSISDVLRNKETELKEIKKEVLDKDKNIEKLNSSLSDTEVEHLKKEKEIEKLKKEIEKLKAQKTKVKSPKEKKENE